MKQEDAHILFDLLRMPLDALRHETGSGRVGRSAGGIRLAMGAPEGGRYHNAQVDDYHQAGGGQQRWGPPLHLRVQARFSHDSSELHGTAGFGFWNDPFGMTQSGRLRLPRALWFFFGGPATDLPLAYGVPGQGWKAATLDTLRGGALALLPVAPLAVPLLNIPALYRRMWPRVQRRLRIGEALVPAAMDDWHLYEIDWGHERCRFAVDGRCLLDVPFAPRGPMGLVVWIDNQYMVATPQGRFGHGIVAAGEQWLEVREVRIVRRVGNPA